MATYEVIEAESKGQRPDKGAWPERFWAKVDKTDGCWNWTGYVNRTGYGVGYKPKVDGWQHPIEVHRIAYELHHGSLPASGHIDHLCRNKVCVNPTHLEPVTHAENLRRGAGTKLTVEQVRWIRETDRDALTVSRELRVSRSLVYGIRSGRKWRDVA